MHLLLKVQKDTFILSSRSRARQNAQVFVIYKHLHWGNWDLQSLQRITSEHTLEPFQHYSDSVKLVFIHLLLRYSNENFWRWSFYHAALKDHFHFENCTAEINVITYSLRGYDTIAIYSNNHLYIVNKLICTFISMTLKFGFHVTYCREKFFSKNKTVF